ncbi:hypothetical protein DUNSADRAFT_1638 [Dunaliella salina]|uniref:Encoded protein n=1 Tax=Dunaliella salina TaxID=3046 RepID=A0ABQ7GWV0_DUNSA|nr:hypothetical protein DUNSADRAFT_1638 [Dunaliella salina]|eukprot:KAF5839093.1 hypothetical protein DUNSADRAFT_1638 [Dunaliella salina]
MSIQEHSLSPVLHGRYGILEIIQVLKALRFWSPGVNSSCGLHIHVGWKWITENTENENEEHPGIFLREKSEGT